MRKSHTEHGTFSWNELLTTDLESARKFYGTLLGWTFTKTETIYGTTYLTALKNGKMVGGMMLMPDDVPDNVTPCWDPYITVDDLEASARQVEELGGSIVLPPTEIENVGRFCVIRDPQGVYLNLMSYLAENND